MDGSPGVTSLVGHPGAATCSAERKKSHLNHVGGIADLAAPMYALGFARGAATQPRGCNGLRREPCESKFGFYARKSIGMAASSTDHGVYMGCLVCSRAVRQNRAVEGSTAVDSLREGQPCGACIAAPTIWRYTARYTTVQVVGNSDSSSF